MESKEYILFYDSGIGGINTLKECVKLLPNENYIYFADDANCPYGNNSDAEILKMVKERLILLLKRYKIKLVVFACNTITTCCVERLRGEFGVDIVGTEPAIIPAIKNSRNKEVLVLATNATLRQNKYNRVEKSVEGKVHSLGLKHLAIDIEEILLKKRQGSFDKYYLKIRDFLNENKNVDGIVLGCTHYCFLREELENLFKVDVYDGNLGVAKRVKWLLECEKNIKGEGKGEIKVVLSSGSEKYKKRYKELIDKTCF